MTCVSQAARNGSAVYTDVVRCCCTARRTRNERKGNLQSVLADYSVFSIHFRCVRVCHSLPPWVRRCGRTIYKFVIIDRSSRASERCTHKTTKTTQHRTVQTPNPKPQTPNRKPQTAKRFSHFAFRIAHFRAFPRFRFSFRWFFVFVWGTK